MKKKVVLLTLLLVFSFSSIAFSALPAVVYSIMAYVSAWSAANPRLVQSMVDSIVTHVAAASLFVAISDEYKKHATIDNNSNIKKPMEIIVVPPIDDPTAPIPVKKAPIKGNISYQDMLAILNTPAGQQKYPELFAASKKQSALGTPEITQEPMTFSPGAVFIADNGQAYQITERLGGDRNWSGDYNLGYGGAKVSYVAWYPSGNALAIQKAKSSQSLSNGWSDYWRANPINAPPPRDATQQEFSDELTGQHVGELPANVFSDRFGNEIDDFIKDNPNVVHFEDDAQNEFTLNEIQRATDYEIERALAIQAAQHSAATSGASAGNARAAANAARAAADANPGDSGLQAAAAAAEAAAAAAEAAAAGAAAELARRLAEFQREREEEVATPNLPGDNAYDANIETPESKSISDLLTTWFESSPLSGMIRSFAINTDAPVKKIVAGTFYGREIAFDFERFEPLLTTCGGVLLVICHGFTVLVIFRGW